VGAGEALALANSSASATSLTASCPTVDVSGPLAGSLADWNDAKANQITLQGRLTSKQAELAPAITARNNAYTNWLRAIRYNGAGWASSIDFRYSNLVNAGNDWYAKGEAAIDTSSQVTLYQDALTSATNQVTDYDNQLANRTATIAALQAQIAALDLQIAAAAEGPAKEQLKLDRAIAAGKLGVVNDLAVLQQERARAEADRVAAVNNLAAAVAANASAQTALTNSRTSYQNAYYGMYDSAFGPYTIYYNAVSTSPAYPSFVSCTERSISTSACTPAAPFQVQTQASVYNYIWDLYGVNRGAPFGIGADNGYGQPHADSVFLRPSKIQKEVDALQKQVTDANQRVIDSKKRYDDLLAQASAPPTCNITGTGVTPWAPATAAGLLLNVDAKGATR
jgi:peptidoglycan hydrolase CwlO-like protein